MHIPAAREKTEGLAISLWPPQKEGGPVSQLSGDCPEPLLSTPAVYFSREQTAKRIKQHCCRDTVTGSATASLIKGLVASFSSGTTV